MASGPVRFHDVHGRNIQLSARGSEATRVESFNQALCFTNRPLEPEEKLFVEIIAVCDSWSGTLRVGVTENDPLDIANDLPKYVCPDLNMRPGNWGKALEEQYAELNKEIMVYYHRSGKVMIQSGSNPPQEFISGISTRKPLYFLFDVYGNTKRIRIGLQRRTPGLPQSPPAIAAVVKSKTFQPKSQKTALFAPYKSEALEVTSANARCLKDGQENLFAVTETKLLPEHTLIVKLDSLKQMKPIKIVLTTEKPESVYLCGSLEKLCDTTYSLSVQSETPKNDDELAISISADGIVYISHNNKGWKTRIHVDYQVKYRVVFDMTHIASLSMIGFTKDLKPVDEAPFVAPTSRAETKSIDCIVCLEADRTVLLEPCDHFSLCETCARSLMSSSKRECPVCRSTIKGIRKIYMT